MKGRVLAAMVVATTIALPLGPTMSVVYADTSGTAPISTSELLAYNNATLIQAGQTIQGHPGDPARNYLVPRPQVECDALHQANPNVPDLNPCYALVLIPAQSQPSAVTSNAVTPDVTLNSWYEAPYMCNAGIAGFGNCAFWHAEMHVGWEGAMNPVQVWLTSTRPNPDCGDKGGIGFTPTVSYCGSTRLFDSGRNLPKEEFTETFTVSFIYNGFPVSDAHEIVFDGYPDGSWNYTTPY